MKFSLAQLKSLLITEKSLDEIVSSLTDIGLEVEEVIDHGKALKDFEVAQIISTTPHPNADKLKICQVQAKDTILQIVCGAGNARAGLKTVLANIGSEIPTGNFKIKASNIRGVPSNGMLCSADELGLDQKTEGIIELEESAQVGMSFAEHAGLDDPVIHINVTPNRGDALSIYGIARDLAAKNIGQLKPLKPISNYGSFDSNFKIDNQSANCSSFEIIEVRNLTNKESPKWLASFLQNLGFKSVSAIVDIANYLSITFGQPLHIYDKAKLKGDQLIIKELESNSEFEALDGNKYHLAKGDLVIADNLEVQCLAGIIGGAKSACSSGTRNIIIESAVFNANSIAKTGQRLRLNTEARHRAERGIDHKMTSYVLCKAAEMIVEICGGECSQIISNKHESKPEQTINFEISYFEKIAGFNMSKAQMIEIFTRLGFDPHDLGDSLNLTISSWRHDIAIKEDLVEELLRIYGYHHIPLTPLPSHASSQVFSPNQRFYSSAKRLLAAGGYNELITWSFCHSREAELFGELNNKLFIINPISNELNYMRPSLLINLLGAARCNIERSCFNFAFFELGPIFNGLRPDEEFMNLSGIRYGKYQSKSNFDPGRLADVYDIKSDVEVMLNYYGLDIAKLNMSESAPSYYHPTRSSILSLGKNSIAYFGEIHPTILEYFGIEEKIMVFEINLSNLPQVKPKFGNHGNLSLSNYPLALRDFAFIIPKSQAIGEILNFAKKFNPELIKSVNLFDIYSGKNIDSNCQSIAFNINLQASDRTLTEDEINNLCNELVNQITTKFSAKLRSL